MLCYLKLCWIESDSINRSCSQFTIYNLHFYSETGRELMHIQSIQFRDRIIDSFSEPQLTDLAGNACLGWMFDV